MRNAKKASHTFCRTQEARDTEMSSGELWAPWAVEMEAGKDDKHQVQSTECRSTPKKSTGTVVSC